MKKILCGLVLVFAGCGTPGYIKAENIDGTLRRVIERDAEYILHDVRLSATEKQDNLRDGELLLSVLNTAKEATKAAEEDESEE